MPLRHSAVLVSFLSILAMVWGSGCASTGPAPGMASIEGSLRTLPREGIEPQSAAAGYGDRRLRDARLVDYDRPGFAVVYVEGEAGVEAEGTSPGAARGDGAERLSIHDGTLSARLGPAESAARVGRAIEIRNASRDPHVVSVPTLGLVRELSPGAKLTVDLTHAGAHKIFLLDAQSAEALVYAAPGPFSVVSSAGDYAIRDLHPGTYRLRVWHPRLPPTAMTVQLGADRVTRVDLTLGVGRSSATSQADPDGEARP